VEPRPFLTEVDVTQAKLVEAPDGTYAVQVMFTDEGSLELDMTSSSSKQLNLVIYTLYPQPGGKESKSGDVFAAEKTSPGQTRVSSWTAAPIVSNLSSGTLEFTPVVTHAEAERIVRGLNNMAADLKTGRR
jgi:hypothetical protein